jgi:hypothetical protein
LLTIAVACESGQGTREVGEQQQVTALRQAEMEADAAAPGEPNHEPPDASSSSVIDEAFRAEGMAVPLQAAVSPWEADPGPAPREERRSGLAPAELAAARLSGLLDRTNSATCLCEVSVESVKGILRTVGPPEASTELSFSSAKLTLLRTSTACRMAHGAGVVVEYPVHAHSWNIEPAKSYLVALKRNESGEIVPDLRMAEPSMETRSGVVVELEAEVSDVMAAMEAVR